MTFIILTLASIFAWFVSMLAGGGSSLVLIPVVSLCLGATAIPPVITIGGIFGNSERIFAYRENINWQVIKWELPGAIVGGCLGAFTFTQLKLEWVTVIVSFFLIISGISFLIKKEKKSFTVRVWYFLPAGFLYAFLSGIIGSMGSVLAPLYLNYGLKKEELLGTQALNRVVVHIIKIIAYGIFGVLHPDEIGYGIIIGLASIPGNFLGHLVLQKMSDQLFRKLVISFILVSGIIMLWQERYFFSFW
jgi:uncharacterized membrane protein YfcA